MSTPDRFLLAGVMQTFAADEAFEVLGVPHDEGWVMHGLVPMGYPTGRWGVAPRRPGQAATRLVRVDAQDERAVLPPQP